MRCFPPVDEERNKAVERDRPRIGVAPGENHAVCSLPTAVDNVSKLDSGVCGLFGEGFEVLSFRHPCHKPRFLQVVDAERSRLRWRWLRRIAADDFQIDSLPERNQCVSRASSRMLTAGCCPHTEESFDRFNTELQVRCRVHEVIDRVQQAARRDLVNIGSRRHRGQRHT